MSRTSTALAVLLLASACATVRVEPDLPPRAAMPLVRGRVHYAGPARYLPATVVDDPEAGPRAPRLAYRVEVSHRDSDPPVVLVLLNPLTLLGFPTGSDTVEVRAELDVESGNEVVRHYSATAAITRQRNIYTGTDLSSLRAKTLGAVQSSIEAQMLEDRELPSLLLDGAIERPSVHRGEGGGS